MTRNTPDPIPVPHPYIPAGPLAERPVAGFQQPEVRQEAFAAVLDGVDLGDYDNRMINWVVGWDDSTARTIASIIWRARCTPAPAAAMIIRQGGADEIVDALQRGDVPGTCMDVALRALDAIADEKDDLDAHLVPLELHHEEGL